MTFWDQVKKNLQQGVAEGIVVVRERAAIVSERAGHMAKKGAETFKAEARRVAKISKLRYDRIRLTQQAQNKLAELGGRVYDLSLKDPKKFRLDLKSQKLIQEAKHIEGQIKKVDLEIQKLSRKGQKNVA